MSTLGGNDEEEAEKQMTAKEPKVQRGAAAGRRGKNGTKPPISIDAITPG
jgi:hypothetical protein